MDLTTRASAAPPPRLGRVILVGLLILALVALAIVAAGSRQQRLPAPYGLARNGALISSADGDIAGLDEVTHASSPLIGGPSFDFGPLFARDGTRFLFLRGAPDGCGQPDCGLILAVADADGTGVRELHDRVSPASTRWTGHPTGPRSRSSPRHRAARAMSSRWSTRTDPAGARWTSAGLPTRILVAATRW